VKIKRKKIAAGGKLLRPFTARCISWPGSAQSARGCGGRGARLLAGDAVRFSGVELQVEGASGVDHGVDELDGVLHVHVVVTGAVYQQQPADEARRGIDDAGGLVLAFVLLGQAHVALGVR